MTDTVDKETRSRIMARVKGKDTTPELMFRKGLFARGFRYRLHGGKLPGKPDLVFPKFRAVVFVNGCFWHGHEGCPRFRLPSSNVEYWSNKIARNLVNDIRNHSLLEGLGWRVLVVWECGIVGRGADLMRTLDDVAEWLESADRDL